MAQIIPALNKQKNTYDPSNNKITVMTHHSSKELEFPRVIIVGIGKMKDHEERKKTQLACSMWASPEHKSAF